MILPFAGSGHLKTCAEAEFDAAIKTTRSKRIIPPPLFSLVHCGSNAGDSCEHFGGITAIEPHIWKRKPRVGCPDFSCQGCNRSPLGGDFTKQGGNPSVVIGVSVPDLKGCDVVRCAVVKPCWTALRIKGSGSSAVHGGPSGRLSSQTLRSSDGFCVAIPGILPASGPRISLCRCPSLLRASRPYGCSTNNFSASATSLDGLRFSACASLKIVVIVG